MVLQSHHSDAHKGVALLCVKCDLYAMSVHVLCFALIVPIEFLCIAALFACANNIKGHLQMGLLSACSPCKAHLVQVIDPGA
jgi:hypothetical protein